MCLTVAAAFGTALADAELVGVDVAVAVAVPEGSGEGCEGEAEHELSASARTVAAEAAVNRRVMEMMVSPRGC